MSDDLEIKVEEPEVVTTDAPAPEVAPEGEKGEEEAAPAPAPAPEPAPEAPETLTVGG